MIKIIKINDEILSAPRYEITLNKRFYVGNLSKSGLNEWLQLLGKKGISNESNQQPSFS